MRRPLQQPGKWFSAEECEFIQKAVKFYIRHGMGLVGPQEWKPLEFWL
jgi:hypothetical protein